jgi:hypothetical protein
MENLFAWSREGIKTRLNLNYTQQTFAKLRFKNKKAIKIANCLWVLLCSSLCSLSKTSQNKTTMNRWQTRPIHRMMNYASQNALRDVCSGVRFQRVDRKIVVIISELITIGWVFLFPWKRFCPFIK